MHRRWTPPAGIASEDGRFAPDGGAVLLRAALPGPPFADRAGLRRGAALRATASWGPARVVLCRPDADLDAYALRPDGTVLAVWNAGGVSELLRARPRRRRGGRASRAARAGPARLVAGRGRRDDARRAHRAARPARPVDRCRCARAATPARLPSLPRRPDRALSVEPVRADYRGADGTPLHGWLYTPPDVHGPNRTVVSFHGGPEGQERPAWSPVAQSLVAAGFTVFAPNVRGSGGQGRAFMCADDGAAREASFDDVPATVRFLVEAGIALPGRVGAHGWSYGGYLTLVALTRWPDLFAAGVSLAGMSDLRSFFAGTEPWMAAASVTEYGDPVADRDLLAALSPMTALDRLTAPVLLAHGDRDTNVPVGRVGAGPPGAAGPRRAQRAAPAAGRGAHGRRPRAPGGAVRAGRGVVRPLGVKWRRSVGVTPTDLLRPQRRSATWSMQAVSALTSSGSTAGNMPTRSWLRPSLR